MADLDHFRKSTIDALEEAKQAIRLAKLQIKQTNSGKPYYELQKENDALKLTLSEKERNTEQLTQQIKSLHSQLSKHMKEYEVVKTQLFHATTENGNLRGTHQMIKSLKDENAELKAQVAERATSKTKQDLYFSDLSSIKSILKNASTSLSKNDDEISQIKTSIEKIISSAKPVIIKTQPENRKQQHEISKLQEKIAVLQTTHVYEKSSLLQTIDVLRNKNEKLTTALKNTDQKSNSEAIDEIRVLLQKTSQSMSKTDSEIKDIKLQVQSKITELKSIPSVENVTTKNKNLHHELEVLKQERVKLISKHNSEINSWVEKFKYHERTISVLKEEIKVADNSLATNAVSIRELKTLLQSAITELDKNDQSKRIRDLEKEIQLHLTVNTAAEQSLKELVEKSSIWKAENEKLKETLQKNFKTLKEENENLRKNQGSIEDKKRIATLENTVANLSEQYQSQRAALIRDFEVEREKVTKATDKVADLTKLTKEITDSLNKPNRTFSITKWYNTQTGENAESSSCFSITNWYAVQSAEQVYENLGN